MDFPAYLLSAGLGSNVSTWLTPPQRKIQITLLAREPELAQDRPPGNLLAPARGRSSREVAVALEEATPAQGP
jgi:hypothetical protein